MRIAWKVRRAGCGPRRRVAAGIASRTMSASSRVDRTGRAATIACAMRRAKRSSPYCEMTAASSRLFVAVHDLGRGQRLLGIHAHVERRVEPVREAAFGSIELRAAHSEIHEDAHDLFSFTVPLDAVGRAARILRAPPSPDRRSERVGSGRLPRRRRHGRVRARARRIARPTTAPSGLRHRPCSRRSIPPGTAKKSSTTSRAITGRCENSSSTLSPRRFRRNRVAADPVFSSPVDRHRPGCLPESATAESGRSRGQQPRRPGS